jgi:hypothetical protein
VTVVVAPPVLSGTHGARTEVARASFGIADVRRGSGFIAAFVGGLVFGIVADAGADVAAFSEELGGVLNGSR